MYQIFTIAILLIGMSSMVFGRNGNHDEKALIAVEKQMVKALTQGDAPLMEEYLDQSFLFSSPTGRLLSREQVIEDLRSGDLKMRSSDRQDMKIRTFGKTAVVTYRSTDVVAFKEQDMGGQYQRTDVFVNTKGKWRLVSEHGTPIGKLF